MHTRRSFMATSAGALAASRAVDSSASDHCSNCRCSCCCNSRQDAQIDTTEDAVVGEGERPLALTDTVSICGSEDNRNSMNHMVEANNRDMWHLRSICHIAVTHRDGSKTFGTAFFAAKRLLLTAAHMLYQRDRGGLADEIVITPGAYRDSNGNIRSHVGSQTVDVNSIRIPSQWRRNEDRKRDFGGIYLPDSNLYNSNAEQSAYRRTPYHFSINDRGHITHRQSVLMFSYKSNGTLWNHGFPGLTHVRGTGTPRFTHLFDVQSGNSGAPLYIMRIDRGPISSLDETVYTPIGIHTEGGCGHGWDNNVAVKLTSRRGRYIKQDWARG